MKTLDILIKRWKSEDLLALPPYGESIVRSTFLEIGMEPAQDLVYLYSVIGGMEVHEANLWRLWPLYEVAERKSEANEWGVLFSDYIMECWAYRVKPNDPMTSAVYVDYFDGQRSFLVAKTLDEFFEKFVKNADELMNHSYSDG